jgi:hypothetical protein
MNRTLGVIVVLAAGVVAWMMLHRDAPPASIPVAEPVVPSPAVVSARTATPTLEPSEPVTPAAAQAAPRSIEEAGAPPPIAPRQPLVAIYTDLYQRAGAGDQVAACRLLTEVESCRRYRRLAQSGEDPYAAVGDVTAMEALDRKLFGMSMEAAATICAGFDAGRDPFDLAPVWRTARTMSDSPLSIRAAMNLHATHGRDPANLRAIVARAEAGDMEAVMVLASEPSLPESLYDVRADAGIRDREALRWLTVQQYVAYSAHKEGPRVEIQRLQSRLDAATFQDISVEATEFARQRFVGGTLPGEADRANYSLDGICGDRL